MKSKKGQKNKNSAIFFFAFMIHFSKGNVSEGKHVSTYTYKLDMVT